MKLLTLNTHSLIEPDYEAKREIFVNFIAAEQPEVFALQEVNQTAAAPLLGDAPAGYYPCPGNRVPLKADNHAAAVARMLEQRGVHYYWSWLPAKVGYDIYDEGAAVFSRAPITAAENLLLSKTNDYSNWKTRRTLGVCAGDTLLREMVEKIVVYECEYDENEVRHQRIDIYYSFVGKIDLPEE